MQKTKELKMGDPDALCIAKNLRLLMKSKNVSESEIARTLNTSVMTIRRVISGETEDPRISTLKLIADYFNVSIDSILENETQNPSALMEKKSPRFIPILNWDILKKIESINKINYSEWDQWYPIIAKGDFKVGDNTFALESRPSMQPRFPHGTLFIITPNESPIDGDLILIRMLYDGELSLRELAIDSPKWQLQPIISGSDMLFYDKKQHDIVGVVVLTLLHNRKQ